MGKKVSLSYTTLLVLYYLAHYTLLLYTIVLQDIMDEQLLVKKQTTQSEPVKKKSRLPSVTPILDRDLIKTYLSSQLIGNPLLYTYYKGLLAPYCIPEMYFVCPFCSFISDTGRTVEKCYNDCKNLKSEETNAKALDKNNKNRNYLIKKITTSQQNKLDKDLVFGWYNQHQFLVVHDNYQYTCLCGSLYKSLVRLQSHFDKCSWLVFITNIKGNTSKAKQFGCDPPLIINYNYPEDKQIIDAKK